MFIVPIFLGLNVCFDRKEEKFKWYLQNCCFGTCRYSKQNVIGCKYFQAYFLWNFTNYFTRKNSSIFQKVQLNKICKNGLVLETQYKIHRKTRFIQVCILMSTCTRNTDQEKSRFLVYFASLELPGTVIKFIKLLH